MVDTINNRRIDILAAGGRDNHFLGTTAQMRRRFLFGREETGTFQYHVHIHFAPRQLCRVPLREYLDLVARAAIGNNQRIAFDDDGAGKLAVRGVIARQMGIGIDRA